MRRLAIITSLCLAALVLCADPALAGRRWRFTPSVDVKATYNDNVQYLGKGDVEVSTKVGALLEIDSERTEHNIAIGVTEYRYGDIVELDRTAQEFSLESIHQATERLKLIGTYNYDVDYTLTTSEEETAEVAQKIRRERQSLTGRSEYMLNERTLWGLNYGYSSTQYAKEYVDTIGHSLSTDIAWAATERLTLLGALSASNVQSEFNDGGSGDYTAYGLTGGFRYRLTEIYTVFANIGNQWTTNELDTSGVDETIGNNGRTFNGGLEWVFERSKGSLTYSMDTTTSLSGSVLERDRLTLQHSYRTTERSMLNLRGTLTQSKSDGVLSTSESRFWSAGANWWYRMTEDHRLFIGYSHGQTENLITNKINERNSAYIRFEFTFPQEWTLGGARYSLP